jgi:hypothetical protein
MDQDRALDPSEIFRRCLTPSSRIPLLTGDVELAAEAVDTLCGS